MSVMVMVMVMVVGDIDDDGGGNGEGVADMAICCRWGMGMGMGMGIGMEMERQQRYIIVHKEFKMFFGFNGCIRDIENNSFLLLKNSFHRFNRDVIWRGKRNKMLIGVSLPTRIQRIKSVEVGRQNEMVMIERRRRW